MAERAFRKQRVKTPDGPEWAVVVVRVRLPPWGRTRGELRERPDAVTLKDSVLQALFYSFGAPLLLVFVRLPFALLRAPFTRLRWVEARTYWPQNESFSWITTREHATRVAEEVAAGLRSGRTRFAPEGSTFLD